MCPGLLFLVAVGGRCCCLLLRGAAWEHAECSSRLLGACWQLSQPAWTAVERNLQRGVCSATPGVWEVCVHVEAAQSAKYSVDTRCSCSGLRICCTMRQGQAALLRGAQRAAYITAQRSTEARDSTAQRTLEPQLAQGCAVQQVRQQRGCPWHSTASHRRPRAEYPVQQVQHSRCCRVLHSRRERDLPWCQGALFLGASECALWRGDQRGHNTAVVVILQLHQVLTEASGGW